jgi:hypothetical protein
MQITIWCLLEIVHACIQWPNYDQRNDLYLTIVNPSLLKATFLCYWISCCCYGECLKRDIRHEGYEKSKLEKFCGHHIERLINTIIVFQLVRHVSIIVKNFSLSSMFLKLSFQYVLENLCFYCLFLSWIWISWWEHRHLFHLKNICPLLFLTSR